MQQFILSSLILYSLYICCTLTVNLTPPNFQVLSITIERKEDGDATGPQAHVAWYGSSTSSLMPCDQLSPFLETFKV